MLRLIITVLLAAMLASCGDDAATPPAGTAAEIPARIVDVRTTTVPVQYVTSGSLTVDRRVVITSRLSGYIRDLAVREGEHVKKGQLLLRVDPTDIRSLLEQARAKLAQAQATYAEATLDYERYRSLFEQNAASRQQFEKAEARYNIAREQVREAQAARKQAENQLAYAEIVAPVDSIVVSKSKSNGDLAVPGAPILILEDPGQLLVETYIDERNISRISNGDKVHLHFPAIDVQVDGEVQQVVQTADVSSHRFLVKVSLAPDQPLHSGMYAQVEFAIGSRPALLLPREAVVDRADLSAVYVVDAGGISHYRLVRTGREWNGQIEITAGLESGDRVAIAADESLRSGMLIKPRD